MIYLLTLIFTVFFKGPYDHPPLLVFDLKQGQVVRHFRTMTDPFKTTNKPPPPRKGLADLCASGSGAFKLEFLDQLKHIAKDHPIVLLDLRLESHGYINETPISWYGRNNSANLGHTLDAVITQENKLLKSVEQHKTATVYVIKDKQKGQILKADPVVKSVLNVENESQAARRLGIGYFRIPVLDRHRPTDEEVDMFIELIQALPEGTWLHIHCRKGSGRTTTFLALYDMMKNGKDLSFDDIIQRQALLGPKDLAKSPGKTSWKYQMFVDRLEFLKAFYRYINDPQGLGAQMWSVWVQNQ